MKRFFSCIFIFASILVSSCNGGSSTENANSDVVADSTANTTGESTSNATGNSGVIYDSTVSR